MKKKILAVLLVLCMVFALALTACTTTTPTTTAAPETTKAEETTAAEEETTAAEEETTAAEEETTAAEEETTAAEEETTAAEEEAASWDNLSWMKDTSPVTMSAVMDFDWYSLDTWGEDEVSKEITRLTGVSLVTEKLSDPQILGVRLAAQELTDIIFCDNMPQRFQDPDICYRWDEIIPQYCPEFWDLVDPLERVNNMADDGHVYTFKTHYKDAADYADENALGNWSPNSSICYREDVLNTLGIASDFTSFEQWEEIMYKVNEKKDELGISIVFNIHPSWTEIIPYWMGCQTTNLYNQEKKSITMKYDDPTWLEYYKYMNKWYNDGILAKDYLGVRPDDFFARSLSGTVFASQYNWGYPGAINGSWRKDGTGGWFDDLSKPYMRLIVGGLTYQGEDRFQYACADYGTGWASCFIATTCKTPDRAICYMEFLKSPFGDRLTQWGIEGVHWELVDGLPKKTDAWYARTDEERSGAYTGIGPWYFQGSDRSEGLGSAAGIVNAADEYARDDALQRASDAAVKKAACANNKNPVMNFARIETTDECYADYVKIQDEWSTTYAGMVTAANEAEVEKIWNDFQAFLAANNYDGVKAQMTERYVTNLKRYQAAGFFTDIVVD